MQGSRSDDAHGPAPKKSGPETLLLVDLPDLPRADARLAGAATLHHCSYAAIDAMLIAHLKPDRVICPLLARGFDASLLAQRLVMAGFRGWLTVIAPRLPDGAMVQRELSSIAPGLSVELVMP
jgi:hypothetical protein